ncbi:hypothetical protein Q3G72_019144 [Acer saccharum]|nr:hypothetical protein Q3G72_019144 [Acer saccharum]
MICERLISYSNTSSDTDIRSINDRISDEEFVVTRIQPQFIPLLKLDLSRLKGYQQNTPGALHSHRTAHSTIRNGVSNVSRFVFVFGLLFFESLATAVVVVVLFLSSLTVFVFGSWNGGGLSKLCLRSQTCTLNLLIGYYLV